MSETTATGKWREPGVSHKGWTCVDIEDLGEPSHTCEMCEVMVVRYVHAMTHPDYPEELRVGCICAGHMEEDLIGAQRREATFKARQARRAKWLTRQWRVSASGNEYLNADGFNVVIFPRRGYWSARVKHREQGGDVRFSQRRYATADEAKLAAFDVMLAMKGEA